MSRGKKTLIIGLSIALFAAVAVLVVYVVNKPSITPTPTPIATPKASPKIPEVNEVTPETNACALSFTVNPETELPACNEVCDETELLCPANLECLIADGETEGVCRLPEYPEAADCKPPDVVQPECNEICDETELLCPSDLECVIEEGKIQGLCRLPEYPEAADCKVPETKSSELDCVVKRAYEDDTRNTAGTYYLNNEIVDTNLLANGQVIVYNIVVANHGEVAVSDTTIDDVLSTNLTFMDASSGCTYDATTRKVKCTIGSLDANTETSKSIRVKIGVAGSSSINNKADVYSTNGQRDVCEITVSATGTVAQPPSPIPSALPEAGVFEVTTATLGVGVLLLVAGALGLLLL